MGEFLQKLKRCSESNDSLLCIGLDPDTGMMPDEYTRSAGGITEFNRLVIEATHDLVCAYKPNFAFYEAFGSEGMRALEQTLKLIPGDIPTIADAKRGDIPNTSRFYANAVFDSMGFDSVTVSPYMGLDSIEPFLEREGKGVWVLCKTSNPGGANLQTLPVGIPGSDVQLYLRVLDMVRGATSAADKGLVVGATSADELRAVRQLAPTMPLLIPGLGAQQGDLRAAAEAAVSGPVVVNSSRSILYGGSEDGVSEGVRERALRARDALNSARAELLAARD